MVRKSTSMYLLMQMLYFKGSVQTICSLQQSEELVLSWGVKGGMKGKRKKRVSCPKILWMRRITNTSSMCKYSVS